MGEGLKPGVEDENERALGQNTAERSLAPAAPTKQIEGNFGAGISSEQEQAQFDAVQKTAEHTGAIKALDQQILDEARETNKKLEGIREDLEQQ